MKTNNWNSNIIYWLLLIAYVCCEVFLWFDTGYPNIIICGIEGWIWVMNCGNGFRFIPKATLSALAVWEQVNEVLLFIF